MIFVILGIIVLLASFFIALVSLVKEQNKVIDKAGDSSKSQRPSIGKGGAKVGPTATVPSGFPKASQDVPKPVVNRELFPWEEGKYKASKGEIDADRAKVEELRSQLAELKKQAAEKTIDEMPQDVLLEPEPFEEPIEDHLQRAQTQAYQEPQIEVQQPKKKLSGEVSIADLKGQ